MNTSRFWQTKSLPSTLLLPASWLYGLGAWLDRALTTPKPAPLPVISVGNLTAGGAGKTPTTLLLASLLQAMGHKPHILTRGYGGAAQTAHRVQAGDSWQSVGDEALLLARVAPTWVGRNRLASAHAAKAAGATILLCDDAHQHHALRKDISLLVVDGPYGLGNSRLLPAGPLREPVAAGMARAQAVIVIGHDASGFAARTSLPVFPAALAADSDTKFLTQSAWLAFAGIGRPEKFYDQLRALGASLVATRNFPDHHPYSPADVAALAREAAALGAKLITTAKDAVKLPASSGDAIATLPVQLALGDSSAFRDWLGGQLDFLNRNAIFPA